MDKRTILENKLYKLLKNRPYNVVRSECDRIGRQIMELDKRTVKVEDKLNCFVDNLEWCTYQYNTNYNGNRSSQAIFQNRSKTIYVYDCNMNFIGEVQGMRKFAREHNISSGSLTNVLSYNSKHPNKFHSCKGFIPFYEKLQKNLLTNQ